MNREERVARLRELRKITIPKRGNRTHGMARTPEYGTWLNMLARCGITGNTPSIYYIRHGVSVCERWVSSFESFLVDMGFRPGPGYSLDRVNPHGNYCPENCRWATVKQQARNKRNVKRYDLDGGSYSVAELSEMYGVPSRTIHGRLSRGWTLERAVLQPVKKLCNDAEDRPEIGRRGTTTATVIENMRLFAAD